MTKVTIIKSPGTKKMTEMEPGEICIVDDNRYTNDEHVVMRTFSPLFEVIDLTDFKEGDSFLELKVRPAPKGTKIIFEVE